jgi:DNA (cytosine-5)-methyltransferase 1
MKKFRFIDLFCGIGGFRKALDDLGGECVFSSDLDDDAKDVYENNFGERPSGDITKIDAGQIPEHDVLCAGFPCQAFSISGNRKGFEDETKGTLFYDIVRIGKHHQPKVIFLENVKNIIGHDKGNTLKIILSSLDEIGYGVFHKVLNASKYGIPQSRERAYFICIRKDLGDVPFVFPEPTNESVCLIDYLEKGVVPKRITKYVPVYKPEVDLERLSENRKSKPLQIGYVHYGGQGDRIYSPYGHAVTLSANGGGNFSKTGGYYIDGYPRRLNSRECANVMGFPKDFKLHGVENTARKQFGNSVVVPLIGSIFGKAASTGIFDEKL